ncbi:hypothetical protein O181_131933 [Austropuccinia psidii MF-1]|uniref:Reverse transcriptase Ty1/copia-type domain-containing protein n=1 Tax=Austropuccinia psidii MF-1 TaxID=1389203 RepID=A0A9Q3QB73_9BASI|nr:hypothetical protein [Austropuccinia psidii MF-1]
MEDLGPIKHILGIKACKDTNVLSLSQNTLIEKILGEYGMAASKLVTTELDAVTYFLPASDEEHRLFLSLGVNYCCAVSLLNYLAILTRPDLAFSVSLLLQHLEKPGMVHWNVFKRILSYLLGTRMLGLTIAKAQLNIRVYADASYANCPVSRRSHAGLMIFLDNTLIHWKSQRQPSVSSSSTKAEYKAWYDGAQQFLWFCKLFNDVSFGNSTFHLILLVDNQPSIALAKNPLSSVRIMNMDIKFNWIGKQLLKGLFEISYVPTAVSQGLFEVKRAWHSVNWDSLMEGSKIR